MGLRLHVVGLGCSELARPLEGAFTGIGAGGQYITILPQLDMVIAHKTDVEQVSPHGPGQRRRAVTTPEYDAILRLLIAAKCPGGKCQ